MPFEAHHFVVFFDQVRAYGFLVAWEAEQFLRVHILRRNMISLTQLIQTVPDDLFLLCQHVGIASLALPDLPDCSHYSEQQLGLSSLLLDQLDLMHIYV
jgi:hypothetical protein